MQTNIKKIAVVGTGIIFVFVAIFTVIGGRTEAPEARKEKIVVHADEVGAPLKKINGLLLGDLSDDRNALIAELKPASWRVNTKEAAIFARSIGAKTVFVMSDAYASEFGGYKNAKPWERGDCVEAWECYEKSIERKVEEVKDVVDYYDIWNEPDVKYFWQGSRDQYWEMIRRTYARIKEKDPEANIVMPSFASYASFEAYGGIEGFLREAKKNGVLFDAIAWHENDATVPPSMLQEKVEAVRAALATYPEYKHAQIHINEFAPASNHLIPGWRVAWLSYLEKANVDQASSACWHFRWQSECGAMFDGLLDKKGNTNSIYWVYKWYAGMEGVLVSADAPADFVIISVRNDAKEEVRIMVGAYSCGAAGKWCGASDQKKDSKKFSSEIDLIIEGYPFGNRAEVAVYKIPNDAGTVLKPLLENPIFVKSEQVQSKGGRMEISLNMDDGEAVLVEVKKTME